MREGEEKGTEQAKAREQKRKAAAEKSRQERRQRKQQVGLQRFTNGRTERLIGFPFKGKSPARSTVSQEGGRSARNPASRRGGHPARNTANKQAGGPRRTRKIGRGTRPLPSVAPKHQGASGGNQQAYLYWVAIGMEPR